MSAQICQTSDFVNPSLGHRFVAAASEAVRSAACSIECAWHSHTATLDHARAVSLMTEIDAHTLKDIGAPEWMIAQSVERQHAPRLYLLSLYQS